MHGSEHVINLGERAIKELTAGAEANAEDALRYPEPQIILHFTFAWLSLITHPE